MEEDPEILYKTKWLQMRLWKNGLDGVHYMQTAEEGWRAEGENTVRERLRRDLPDEI